MKFLSNLMTGLLKAAILMSVALPFACSNESEVPDPAADKKDIMVFSMEDYECFINESNSTITVSIPANTDVMALVPAITVSEGAEVLPASGTAQDFSEPVEYTVTAKNKSIKTYTVTVEYTYGLKDFKLNAGGYIYTAQIDHEAGSIIVAVSFRDVRKQISMNEELLTEATLQNGYTLSPTAGNEVSLDDPAPMQVVIGPNGTEVEYTLTIKNSDNWLNWITFVVPGVDEGFLSTAPAEYSYEEYTQGLPADSYIARVLPTDDISAVTIEIQAAERATIDPSPEIPRNFHEDLTYNITSESGQVRTITLRFIEAPVLFLNDHSSIVYNGIKADGSSFQIAYRSVSPITAATLVNMETGEEVNCAVSTSASGNLDYITFYPASAFAAGEHGMKVTLEGGEVVETKGQFRAE